MIDLSIVLRWFNRRKWEPFPFQRQSWAAYLAGESGLIHASTGIGKTYAAWMGPLTEWLAENPNPIRSKRTSPVPLRVLWVTPLRALSADTAHNLQAALDGLSVPWTLETRTSDTPSNIRNRQRNRLPTALITTPESLSILLARADAYESCSHLRCVVIDEWHELLGSKRGVQTELALARLRHWNPNLRIWGLSATLGNPELAMRSLLGGGAETGRLIQGSKPKHVIIDSLIPDKIERFPWAGHLGLRLLPQVADAIDKSESALVFTNTRAQSESWYQQLLKLRPDWAGQIALHHGSLDRGLREWVENGLREGRLRCVVCTSSLDLGVDFPSVDRVLQIGSPKGIARLLQRAGRSGHTPDRPSCITCVPTHALEMVEVAAARSAAQNAVIENREALDKPLDVLAQHLVTVALGGGFEPNELLAEIRTCWAYRHLTDAEWAWILNFVTCGGESLGAYPEFHKVVDEDGRYTVTDSRIARLHRMSIGTIVGDATVEVRFLRGSRLGRAEESFIAKLKPGDQFIFAGRVLEFVRFYELTAWVRLAKRGTGRAAKWSGGRLPLSSELAGAIRDRVEEARNGVFDGPEMRAVAPILQLQAERSKLPAPNELLIERCRTREGHHVFVYPLEGRLVHEGMSALFAYRISRLTPITFTLSINDYGFELLSADSAPLDAALRAGLLDEQGLDADLRESMNATELARRQFREIARVAGLVHPGMPRAAKSMQHIQASSGLFYNVFAEYDPGNLLLLQAQNEVLQRQLEYQRMERALHRLRVGQVSVVSVDRPTPFGFPLLVERWRESVSSEKLEDRIQRMQVVLDNDD